MKPQNRRENVQPRTGQTHGLFGVKFLKYHNMRDPNWTSEDLITQYEKLSNIFRELEIVFCELNLIVGSFIQVKPTKMKACKEIRMRREQLKITSA